MDVGLIAVLACFSLFWGSLTALYFFFQFFKKCVFIIVCKLHLFVYVAFSLLGPGVARSPSAVIIFCEISIGTQTSEKCRLQHLVTFDPISHITPIKKNRSLDLRQIFIKSCQSNHCVQKCPLRRFFWASKETRMKEIAHNSDVRIRVKLHFFISGPLIGLKNCLRGRFRTY